MKFNVIGSLIAVVAAMVAQGAYAQASSPTRAAVKAEAAAAEKKGEIKAGEQSPIADKAGAKSDKTRDQRKAETKEAIKKGETPKAGEAGEVVKPGKSEKTRDQRKAETKEAIKKGETLPAGEAGTPKK